MGQKKDILIIQAGGTVCQKPDENGVHRIDSQDYLHLIPGLNEIANITTEEVTPIDSTNMNLPERKGLIDIIRKTHENYDGFVVIQGTDTMADSAIATNYMVQKLGKPIIFTGAQLPIYTNGTDAIQNIHNAVNVATKDIGESAIVFNNKIIRGSRAVKRDSEDFYAFYSPKSTMLGAVVRDKVLMDGQIKRKNYMSPPKFFTNFKKNVFYYNQISGADTNILEKIVQDVDIDGIIIGGYGTGNVNDKYLIAIEEAIKRGKPVAITTACQYGTTNPTYAVGAAAIEAGAFLAYDLTKEAAGQKMMYALGIAQSQNTKRKNIVNKVKKIMHTPIGKDITIPK